ncbi:hypothetical protein [Verrucomicrobium sp. BvORR106]|uniref:hypothetical protein n=1 Tax=Verrucomicrobium sp. BvORR106 TaxID=1403819 RepID=UPI00068EE4E5|nr:hypothetical protein [Verrucomicrobium sp. BvORR106]
MGSKHQGSADYLDVCRIKRNTAEYDAVGTVSSSEAVELRGFTKELQEEVLQWLKIHCSHLVS